MQLTRNQKKLLENRRVALAMYEVKKSEWVANNPNATPAEYESFIRQIQKELKV